MSLVIWAAVAFMLGLVIYIAVPMLFGPLFPAGIRQRLAEIYFSQATATMRRTTLLDRINSGFTLIATGFDAEWGCELTDVGDQEYRIEDPRNRMARLYSRPFGMASERFDVYCSARDAAAGKAHQLQAERGNHRHDVAVDGGDQSSPVTVANAHVTIPDGLQTVSLHGIAGILGGQASPTLGEDVYDDIKKSQAAFDSRSVLEGMTFIVAFAAVFGLMWFAANYGGSAGGGGGGINVPLMVEVLLL